MYFEAQAYNSVQKFIDRQSINGSALDSLTEVTKPNNSSTGDTVIMANYKIDIGNGYNVVYLFEFHVNSNGKIYGFNAWEY